MTSHGHDTGGTLFDEIEEQAIEWLVRADQEMSARDSERLDAWLAESAAHRAAYIRVSALWKDLDSLCDQHLDDQIQLHGNLPQDRALSAFDIERQAAAWLARMDLRATPEERVALDGWLNAHPRHRAAFLRLSIAWRRADELKKLVPRDGIVDPDLLHSARWIVADSAAEQSAGTARSHRLRVRLVHRVAASFVVLVVLILGGFVAWRAVDQRNTQVYSTHVGELQRVTLEDGSTIALNTDSEVRVRYSADHRRVALIRGEALFQVAKNKERPFDVEAGRTTVRAVGTVFSVRLHATGDNDRVDVVVSEGRIVINPPSNQIYSAGNVAVVRDSRVDATAMRVEDVTSKVAWSTGRLVFQGEKLSEVVEEFNRYNARKIQIADPDLADLRIGGSFTARDPDGFVRALGATFGIKAHAVEKSSGADVIELDSGVP